MSASITHIWEGLRDAGLPEVMLFLPDGTASRCNWDETTMIGPVRVALLGDQDRKIVRVIPVESCIGIGIASPKGVDTSSYRWTVLNKLGERLQRGEIETGSVPAHEPTPAASIPVPAQVAVPVSPPGPGPAHVSALVGSPGRPHGSIVFGRS